MPKERNLPPQPNVVSHYTLTPDDLTKALSADQCHKNGITGEGIVVGIVDSGFYAHKYFEIRKDEFKQKYKKSGWNLPTIALPHVVSTGGDPKIDPEVDKSGHGTGMAANLLSLAPCVILRMYPVYSFMSSLEAAVEQCQIVSLSKHSDVTGHVLFEQKYKAALKTARENGKIVFHASGNGISSPWPIANCPQEVIKVGGVHRRRDGTLEASNYGSAHGSTDKLPDICGLCGMAPAGAYIWLPADPNSNSDQQEYALGWNLASGTSSATPQVAGICALMLQARAKLGMPALNAATAKSILRRTATAVSIGASYDGVNANPKWCLLANAAKAVQLAVQ